MTFPGIRVGHCALTVVIVGAGDDCGEHPIVTRPVGRFVTAHSHCGNRGSYICTVLGV